MGVSTRAQTSLLWTCVTAPLLDHPSHDPLVPFLPPAWIAPRDIEGDGDWHRRGRPGWCLCWWSLWPISVLLWACQTDKTGACQIK